MKKQSFAAKGTATLAALVFAFGIGGIAGSAEADETTSANSTITVTAPTTSGSTSNLIPPTINAREFTAYQLATYTNVQVSNGAVTGYGLSPASGVTDEQVRNWLKAAVITDGIVDTDFSKLINADGTFIGDAANLSPLEFVAKYFVGSGTDSFGNDHADSQQMRLFADAAEEGPLPTTSVKASGANNEVVFNTPSEGLYMIVENAGRTPASETVSNVMIVGTAITVDGKTYTEVNGVTLGKIALKAQKVEGVKKVSGNDQIAGANSVRTFTITANIPDYKYNYATITDPKFVIADGPTDNVNPFNADGTVTNLKVEVNDGKTATTLKKDTDYTVSTQVGQSIATNDFLISLTNPRAYSNNTITVTYDATIKSVTDPILNDSSVEFSNDPYGDSIGYVESEEKVYTTKIQLDKIKFNDASKTILPGATFAVTDNNGKAVNFSVDADGNYTVDAKGTSNVITAGQASIFGLGADSDNAVTYTFTETKAPEGYLLGSNPVQFTVTVTPHCQDDGELTDVTYNVQSQNHKNFLDETDSAMWNSQTQTVTVASLGNDPKILGGSTTLLAGGTIYVENTTNASDFAKTGGEITRVLTIVVILAVIGAVLLVVARMRKRNA